MANEVYANGMEIACKAGAGKVIAAFPDVCMTPPENPATPPGIPIPYPNTAMASDTTDGSKKVKISGDEIMLKNKSCFKTSTGDEAGCAAKKGVVSSKNKGKVYFVKWSMDVKVEGENVDRHFDMTTNNHGSPTANEGIPWVYVDSAAISDTECKELVQDKNDCMEKHTKQNITKAARKKHKKPDVSTAKARASAVGDTSLVDWDALLQDEGAASQAAVQRSFCKDEECKDKLDCALVPFDGFCCPTPDKEASPPVVSKTPHHIVPAHCFLEVGGRSEGEGKTYDHVDKYKHKQAPCICLDGAGKVKEHGRVHETFDAAEQGAMDKEKILYKIGPKKGQVRKIKYTAKTWSFEKANDEGSAAVEKEKPKCKKECLKQQSAAAHKNMMGDQIGPETPLRADPFGTAKPGFVPGTSAPDTTTAP